MCPLGLTHNQGGIFLSCLLPSAAMTNKHLITLLCFSARNDMFQQAIFPLILFLINRLKMLLIG